MSLLTVLDSGGSSLKIKGQGPTMACGCAPSGVHGADP